MAVGDAPALLKDAARSELGPDERRSVTELNGEDEVANGIALHLSGADARDVIDSIKQRMAALLPSLPEGAKIAPVDVLVRREDEQRSAKRAQRGWRRRPEELRRHDATPSRHDRPISRALTPPWRSRDRCSNCRMLSCRFADVPIR
ncbi:MAG: efflux RND transporter permease subunit [Pseudomonadota bacterium]|nr:efflux RND transporter permease subunit [Pseudomonadota bacterium]